MLKDNAPRAMASLALAALLSSCASLPSNGPTAGQISREVAGPENVMGYRIVNITPATLPDIEQAVFDDHEHLAVLAAAGDVDTIGPGDVLTVDIYEVGTTLFGGGATAIGGDALGGGQVPSARGQGIGSGGVVVDRNGTITVPYVGQIKVAGMTPAEVQERIRRGLAGMSQRPQVLVSVRQNVTNTVTVMGAVGRPGRQPLTLARSHLLDAIADAGGFSLVFNTGTTAATGPQDMIVRFTRDGRTIEQPLDTIRSGSPDDLLLLPGDRIELIRQPRSLLVFGATNRVSQLPFESSVLTLAEAIARVGGPSDTQADPRAIFVFRNTPGVTPPAVTGTAVPPPIPGAPPKPMIYRLNMMQAQSYFLSQRFMMQDKDVIYIANARSNQPAKLVQILNVLFSPVFTALQVRAITR